MSSSPEQIDDQIKISVVIPVYRSENSLLELYQRLSHVLNSMKIPWQVIFVDDNSPDQAWKVLEEIKKLAPQQTVIIQLMRNFGQHNALMCGFHHASGEFIVTIDDDLQNPPEEVPRLYQAITEQNLDLVYGSIHDDKQHSAYRNYGSYLINSFMQIIFKLKVQASSFRIIRSEVIRSIVNYNLNYTFIDGLLCWATQRIGAIKVKHEPRKHGTSGYSLSRLVQLAFNLFTNFSLIPLQLVSLTGFVVAILGFLFGIYNLLVYFIIGISVSGYSSIIVSILVMGGVQLLSLGVMGEYLGRIHINMNRKPQFIVRQVHKDDRPKV